MALVRLTLPRRRALLGVLLFGTLIFDGAFSFAYYALVRIHAGLGQTLLALVPLATLCSPPCSGRSVYGSRPSAAPLFLIAGIGVISGVSGSESVPVLSLLAVLGAVLCFAQATVLVRQFPPVHPVTTNAVGMATGAAILRSDAVCATGHGLPCPCVAYRRFIVPLPLERHSRAPSTTADRASTSRGVFRADRGPGHAGNEKDSGQHRRAPARGTDGGWNEVRLDDRPPFA